MTSGPPPPSEESEQRALAAWLDIKKLWWCHVPNGGLRHSMTGLKLKAQGAKPGVPDILIFTPPPNNPAARGVAIEVKRTSRGVLSGDQRIWLQQLERCGWEVLTAKGARAGIAFLVSLGY